VKETTIQLLAPLVERIVCLDMAMEREFHTSKQAEDGTVAGANAAQAHLNKAEQYGERMRDFLILARHQARENGDTLPGMPGLRTITQNTGDVRDIEGLAHPLDATLCVMSGVVHLCFGETSAAVQVTATDIQPATPEMIELLDLQADDETSDHWAALQDEGEGGDEAAVAANRERLLALHGEPRVIAKKARLAELTRQYHVLTLLCNADSIL
jgi:hypothetical protein